MSTTQDVRTTPAPRRTPAVDAPAPPRRRLPLTAIGGVALLALMVLLPLVNLTVPGVLPGPTYTAGSLNLLALCMVYASLALSYHLLLGTGGMLSFGHALYFGAGAYGLGIILAQTGIPLWPAVLVTILGVMMLAVVTGAISLRVTGIPFAMVTLAFAEAGSVLVRRNPRDLTNGGDGLIMNSDPVPEWMLGVVNTRNLYWMSLVLLAVVFLVVVWIDRSRVGHVTAAARENELRVRVLGLRPYTAKLVVFAVSGLLASTAGIMYLFLHSGTTPTSVSANLTITVLLMVVIGGVGSRWGAVAGAVVYTLFNQRLTKLAESDFVAGLPDAVRIPLSQPLFILGTVFVLIVLFLPGGIAGTLSAVTARWRRTDRGAPHGAHRLEQAASESGPIG
ncbi:branched-chain amino acid ABC transporter permease [Nocardioides sp. JQ2195]|uniref:branched-chain amino acid ABC transporter permease n=1 Tax=Nocardioides sp. JQ2195 TaxID=2592334 RepID=UPI00143E91DB|nr:branched-chain amino acid ABC transporter permease [Nocardioides sp. JQ2195]QIX25685.1 branched-chain amino acid ABC transporter permease [Nocardioides sp. JQ2195]